MFEGFPRKCRTPSVRIVYRHIGENLYWGSQEKRTRLGSYKIAEPEKALLDWIYLQRQESLRVALDDQNLKVVDREKVLKYAAKYPIPVQQTAQFSESARAMVDAMQHTLEDPSRLTPVYALISRMRLSSPMNVVKSAECVVKTILTTLLEAESHRRGNSVHGWHKGRSPARIQ